jgi:hypothetical protein
MAKFEDTVLLDQYYERVYLEDGPDSKQEIAQYKLVAVGNVTIGFTPATKKTKKGK